MKVVFTGDLFLGGDLLNKSAESIVYSNTFTGADKKIVNLEQPISDNDLIADKCTLHTGSFAIKQLKQLNVDAVNLAHNHIQDKEKEGIVETVGHLDNSYIGHFGAGKDIFEAQKPYWIASNLCILGSCEFGRPYLKQIQVATDQEPGINPLRYESIVHNLNQLPEGTKAVLYFHWGREHVWLPPVHDIELAKKLLEDERVLLIVGMHCHRVQGYVEHKGKRAYMSLGNFLFPNFFISPPTQIAYPEILPEKYMITRQYHNVSKLTYKKWRVANRVSLILEYDSETQNVRHVPLIQEDDEPKVQELLGISKKILLSWISFLSQVYKLPYALYNPLENINSFIVYKLWRSQIFIFQMRQYGLSYCMKKAVPFLKSWLNRY
ncbi:Capsule biosynthesis protein capA [Methanosarcina sp. MTP4]|uniref:CapA family protein n=1 Tax=Methanosarcina sp. MTP4 TaxID=1434100 RepID=UPI000615C19E|nr:CapA family protein [Methanosarcina sp. MTP4]AKB23624.1 Capsule biosynthesis protein capA [Methanosarcina sp. MTP4]